MRYYVKKSLKKPEKSESQVDPKELAFGILIELEHTTDYETAKKIALHHLSETPDYYTDPENPFMVEIEKEYFKKSLGGSKKRLIKQFLRKTGDLSDKELHDFADSIGVSHDEVEEYLYSLAKEHIEMHKSLSKHYDKTDWDRKYTLQGTLSWNGLNIGIENKRGSTRTGKDPDGNKWRNIMTHDYGRIQNTRARDREHVDCYIGNSPEAPNVYVIHQIDPWRNCYDEDKCMIGFWSKPEAIDAYLENYDKPDYLGDVEEFTVDEFKEALIRCFGRKITRANIEEYSFADAGEKTVKIKKGNGRLFMVSDFVSEEKDNDSPIKKKLMKSNGKYIIKSNEIDKSCDMKKSELSDWKKKLKDFLLSKEA